MLGDEDVIADEEEGGSKDGDDCYDNRGQGFAGVIIGAGKGEGSGRGEKGVAPLGTVDGAEALGAALASSVVGKPVLLAFDRCHEWWREVLRR